MPAPFCVLFQRKLILPSSCSRTLCSTMWCCPVVLQLLPPLPPQPCMLQPRKSVRHIFFIFFLWYICMYHCGTQMAKQMRKVQKWLPGKIWCNTAWKARAKLSIKHDRAYKSLQLLKSIICKTAILLKIFRFIVYLFYCSSGIVTFPKATVGKYFTVINFTEFHFGAMWSKWGKVHREL